MAKIKHEYIVMQRCSDMESDILLSGKIMDVVSSYYGVTTEDMKYKGKGRTYVWPRQVFCYLCMKHTKMTLADVGAKVNRTHCNTIYSKRTVENLMSTDHGKKEQIAAIEMKLF